MERPPVSIVIPVWNAWPFTKLCLETLRPTLGVRDEIIVVDNGSTDATQKELRNQTGIRVITNEENLGFAKANNQGAEIAANEIIVFLNNDTAVPRGWLDELVKPFEDKSVGATGPRTNHASGSQIIDPVPYRESRSMGDFREFARDWMRDHRGSTSETDRLVGFCIAVRKDAFVKVGSWDEQFGIGGYEDDDLSTNLIKAGYKLLVCDGSFIHHHGSRTFTENKVDQYGVEKENAERYLDKHAPTGLVSACIITKDEEANIAECIESLKGFVDEVIVYDTGSVDKTIEAARAAGAKPSMGFWNDDFSRARNAALDLCTGTWILHIDADERLELDEPGALRSHLLRSRDDLSIMVLPILNIDDALAGGDVTHNAARLFRREMFHWEGRLHEKVVLRNGEENPPASMVPAGRLVHYGYTKEAIDSRKKTERNIRLARVDLADGEGDIPYKKFNLGRSLMMSGENTEAIELFSAVLIDETSLPSKLVRDVLRSGVEANLDSHNFADAKEWLERLSATELDDQSVVHYLRAQSLYGLGDFESALSEFNCIDETSQESSSYSHATLWHRRALCYEACDDYANATSAYLRALDLGFRAPIWPKVIELSQKAGSVDDLLAAIENYGRNAVWLQVALMPAVADQLGELCWNSGVDKDEVLERAIRFAHKVSHMRALEWSKRLREHGNTDLCPLIAMTNDELRDPVQRVQAAAIAANVFGDLRGENGLRIAAAKVKDEDLIPVLAQLLQKAPSLIQPFLESAATSENRALHLARAMDEAGAPGVGDQLRAHAASMSVAALS